MIYDISQEVFSGAIYPGDPAPSKKDLMSINKGYLCNLTGFSMCAHNGTHIDAPYHFYNEGKTVDQLPLEKFVGPCYVIHHEGELSQSDAIEILERAKKEGGEEAAKKILVGGKCTISERAAKVFADAEIDLIGNESQTVGPLDTPMAVHHIMLGAEVVLLEGIRLGEVPEGVYMLNAAPINLGGADGAPCRAILMTI